MTPGGRIERTVSRASLGLALALALLWLSSYRWYTTIGFDFERPAGPLIVTTYERLRWDAGSFWIGQAEQPHSPHSPFLDWWDPGGTLFAPSVSPARKTFANRAGFWLIADVSGDPYEPIRYPGATSSHWIGIPASIPPALAVAWPITRLRARKRTRRREKADRGEAEKAIV